MMRSHVSWCFGLLAFALACGQKHTARGEETSAGEISTSTDGETEGTGSSGSETTGDTCLLGGDPCVPGECCEGLECDPDSDVCVAAGESGSGFIPGIDDSFAVGTCDPGLQDCPEGEKCTAYVMTPGYCCVDANKCVEDKGDKQLGDVCTRGPENDDCDKGLFCMTKTSGDTGEGVCLAFCDINNAASCQDAGLPDADCIAFNDGILPLCQDDCDPLAQDCTPPQGCYPVGSQGFVCTLPGYDDGKGNDDDDCYTIQSCKPGLLCANGDGQNGCGADACCTPFCDLSGDGSECGDAMEECVAYYEEGMAPPGYEDVGICFIPA